MGSELPFFHVSTSYEYLPVSTYGQVRDIQTDRATDSGHQYIMPPWSLWGGDIMNNFSCRLQKHYHYN